jgi:hypothetical protein
MTEWIAAIVSLSRDDRDSHPRRRCEMKVIAGEMSEITGDVPKRGRIMKMRMMVP